MQQHVIILGAGRPVRGENPSALWRTPGHRRVLDWIVAAWDEHPGSEFHFVGGFHLEEVVRNYPQIAYTLNPDWESTGAVGSLFAAPLPSGQFHYVCYSDVVFSKGAVQALADSSGDVVLAVDREWRVRYSGRSRKDLEVAEKVRIEEGQVVAEGEGVEVDSAEAEFVGLLKLSPHAVETIQALKLESSGLETANLPDLIERLRRDGLSIETVDIGNEWAELNAPQDLARFVLGTKAQTLDRLKSTVKLSKIGDQVSFSVSQWAKDRDTVLAAIVDSFGSRALIIRSSSLAEDSWSNSQAGAFLSVMDVCADDRECMVEAIERVIASYPDDHPDNEVLVQEMVANVHLSGVIMTRTLSYGAPYYTVNYDDTSKRTDSVTDGTGENLKTLVIHRSSKGLPSSANPLLGKVLPAVQELESLVGHDSLDVEFAVTDAGTVHVFQLRPIAVDHTQIKISDEDVDGVLQSAEDQFQRLQSPGAFVLGERAHFGVMPDWNPAEIIGTKPHRLALSLYRYLVTDEVWAAQRAEAGYRDVRPQPLLVCFAGHPYIDVRASFNSFIPESLPDSLAARLVDHYLGRFQADPHLHDKVEFDILFTCMTLDFDLQSKRLSDDGFSQEDIGNLQDALRDLTTKYFRRYESHLKLIDHLEARYQRLMATDLGPLDRACALLEDCRRFGTLPFAHLARSAFVATAFLRSAVSTGVISNEEMSAYLASMQTVAKTFQIDAGTVRDGAFSWAGFVQKYGHLRPGTYEITSLDYASDPEEYLRPAVDDPGEKHDQSEWEWKQHSKEALSRALADCGLGVGFDDLDSFMRSTIEGREYAKFAFTRNLSSALEFIAEYGQKVGLSREQLAHTSVEDLLHLRVGISAPDPVKWLEGRINDGAKWAELTDATELPPILTHVDELRAFAYPDTQPNFVSGNRASAEVVEFSGDSEGAILRGKIVMIPRADPGYDWLFGQGIAGLITMYGGANSHMAVRAAEFGLPAAVGVGEKMYAKLSRARRIELDCAARSIRVIN